MNAKRYHPTEGAYIRMKLLKRSLTEDIPPPEERPSREMRLAARPGEGLRVNVGFDSEAHQKEFERLERMRRDAKRHWVGLPARRWPPAAGPLARFKKA